MTPELIAFLRGRISIDGLTERIELPQSLRQQIDMLWHSSVADIKRGIVQEHGGLLVLDPQDRLQLVNIVSGDAFRLQLCFERHEDYVGTFHTHPNLYGMAIAFSAADFADAVNAGEMLSLLQSGPEIYALFRSENTPAYVDGVELARYTLMSRNFYVDSGFSIEDAIYQTNVELCIELRLAFYSGFSGRALERIVRP